MDSRERFSLSRRFTLSEPKHSPEVYVALAETGLSNYQIAEKLNVDEASVRRGLRRAGFKRLLRPLPENGDGDFLDVPLRITGPVAVSADWHIPLVDYVYASRFLSHCEAEGIKTLAIAGDFFNHDALSAYDYKQESADLQTELREAENVMYTRTPRQSFSVHV